MNDVLFSNNENGTQEQSGEAKKIKWIPLILSAAIIICLVLVIIMAYQNLF
ncbi:MAG: hypothetical protein K9J16_04045 [Melioribacteraceae bacterium]|nr:hypothetical protein [Melioribacteraceae bacterium]MCF8353711.1 hypothetical protein [Melioribacteraceae bacterium]MCF8394964.1 hypothetical protein [Melioribacteraceae bacterium]MCF8418627.1 hypothetical protein [Melioribacteraceae bacterium]